MDAIRTEARHLMSEAHEYAQKFPLEDGATLEELAADIKQHGQREPIQMYGGKVLDGRRRELACLRAKVKPVREEFTGTDAEAIAFVISKNVHRRNLTDTQRALIAADFATMTRGGDRKSAEIKGSSDPLIAPSTAKAAEMMNVSPEAVKRARKVTKSGTPTLKKAVEDRTISVSDAAKVASDPPDVQNKAVEQVRAGTAKTATQAAKAQQNGRMTFDWAKVDRTLGPVIRLTDEIKNAYNLADSELAPLREMLSHVVRDFGILKGHLTRSKA